MSNRFSTFKNSFDSKLIAIDKTIVKGLSFDPIKELEIMDKEQPNLDYTNAIASVNDVIVDVPGEYLVKVENILSKSEPDKKFFAEYTVTVKDTYSVKTEPRNSKQVIDVMPSGEEELYETTKPYTFTLKPTTREKLRRLTKMQKKKSDSAFLSELIDALYDTKTND
ncbi:hypothetical protein IA854_13875 [Listeria seeligeri]|uniref:hypothetical protein n=1 Tax=Listeria seeligeri TaxID=1640 RepID=UPI0018887CE1|nr:hypothetical protein [Listeria seeligeri]MBF2375232.1 hypothetical protein [Listeria seeligeri]UCK61810.1 hypothetical protein pLIS51_00016 [Listeria seeligeri]